MAGTKGPDPVSTNLERIAEQARRLPDAAFTSLNQYLTLDLLYEAYQRTNRKAAPGVDGVTAKEYEASLDAHLRDLLERAKSGTYRAPPVKRAHIPKGPGETRPLGIPTLEDRVLQQAVRMILEPVYEEDFYEFSYGYRPGKSAHDALESLWQQIPAPGCWIIEVDIRKFFDNLDHVRLRELLDLRVRDGVLRTLIHKWLRAGVLEDGSLSFPPAGTPQGGVISPLLANVYLHEVLDKWFEGTAKPKLKGHAFLIRYADDFVIGFEREDDMRKVMDVLPKRFGKYGLTLHPEKTRVVDFRRPEGPGYPRGSSDLPRTFDFLALKHYWGLSKKKKLVVRRKTALKRFSRALAAVSEWCRTHRHLPVEDQAKVLRQKLRGHYGYFGITGNYRGLARFLEAVVRTWRKWLDRRSQRKRMPWKRFKQLLVDHPLPRPRVVHSAYRERQLRFRFTRA